MKKLSKHISFIFLFSILFSFSVSAINSLKKAESISIHHKCANFESANDQGLPSEDLVFEENENDTEDNYQESALLFTYALNLPSSDLHCVILEPVQSLPVKSSTPLYLSIHVIRI
jgi:hypothetical protein